MIRATIISITGLAAALPVCSAMAGQNVYTSVQDGSWINASTWNSGIPGSGVDDRAVIGHSISLTTPIAPNDVDLGLPGQPGILGVHNGAHLTVNNLFRVGHTGGQSDLFVLGGIVVADQMRIGSDGAARLVTASGSLTTQSGVFIGADGHPALLDFGGTPFSFSAGGGLTIGADASVTDFVYHNSPLTPIDVPFGDVTLSPGWQILLEPWDADALTVGDRFDFITYEGTATISDPGSPGSGAELTIDDSVPGVLTIVVTKAPQMRWTAGTGMWSNAAHWDALILPELTSDPIIANGGTAQLYEGSAVHVDEMYVGLFEGNGHLELTSASLTTTGNLSIAAPNRPHANFTAGADITASLTATDAAIIVGEDLDQSSPDTQEVTGSSNLATQFTMNGGTLDVGGDFSIGCPDLDDNVALAMTDVSSLMINGASLVTIGEDLAVGDTWHSAPSSLEVTSTVLIENVGEFRTMEDLDLGDMDGDGSGQQLGNIDVTARNTFMNQFGDVDLASCTINDLATIGVHTTLTLEDCTWNVTEEITIAQLAGGGGDATNVAEGIVRVINTSVTAGGLELALHRDATPGTLRGRLELTRSFLETDPDLLDGNGEVDTRGAGLELGSNAELRFDINGNIRATAGTAGDSGLYSAIDIRPSSASEWEPVLAQLGGRLELDFTAHTSIAGGDSFEVIRNLGDIAFTGAFDEVITIGLPAGLDVSVTVEPDGPNEVVRITITSSCAGDLDGDGTVAFTDLLQALASWGPCPGCPADLDGDDVVGFSDLLTILSAWGDCP